MLSKIVLICLLGNAWAQFGGMPGQMSGPPAKPVRSDVKYIRCEVCQHLAKNAYRLANAYKREVSQRQKKHEQKVKELDILERIEKLTNPLKEEGEWITKLDLVESGDKLLVKEQLGPGKCGTECKTIEKAAVELIENIDTDLAEKLWKDSDSRSQFENWLCKEATNACKAKTPKVPRSRPPGPEFQPVDPEELKMQRMMASMKEMGMGGKVFDRQQAQKFAKNAKEEDFDDYDDEDDLEIPGAQNTASKISSQAGSTIDSAKETVNSAFNAAKDVSSGLLDKAQSWLGGKKSSEEL